MGRDERRQEDRRVIPVPAFIAKNPGLWLRIGGFALVALTIGALLWRVHYLAEKNDAQRIELKRYEKTVENLVRLGELRERIITEDLTETLNNERSLSDDLLEIERTHETEDAPVAPVLRDAIDRLYVPDSP